MNVYSSSNKPIFLIDARYLCYRSVYGLLNKPIREVRTSMFYGFTSTLLSLSKGLKKTQKQVIHPSNVIILWDSKHSFRKVKYPSYKEKATKLTEAQVKVLREMKKSFPRLREWMQRIGFHNPLYAGYEADDLFAGYIDKYKHEKFIMVANDEDLFQLLCRRVSMWVLKKKPYLFTEDDFKKKYKINPNHWSQVKAMGGCTSDNIPGIDGIGEKRAIDLIKATYYTNDPIPKYAAKVKENHDKMAFYFTLTHLPLEGKKFGDLPIEPTNIDLEQFTKFCQVYNFKSFIFKLRQFEQTFSFGDAKE